jgi:non-specific serine/threonine protein kinase/serine/threonine-protein kinase
MNEWDEIQSIFWQCLSSTADERAAILAQTAARNPHLAGEVRRMLAAHEDKSTFLEDLPRRLAPLLDPTPLNDAIPEKIGPFKVIRELGHGGMGTVYLGQNDAADFEQLVAIKLIKKGLDIQAVIDRFRRERRILARLEHPHIARLYYGGATEDGLPYFVMEFVQGQPITEFCQAHNLAPSQAIALFRKVCDAVHYAHQNLVIHRDIKPSNILIDKNGDPKLLDFGVAKWLAAEDSTHTLPVVSVGFTPDYASPEQLRCETVTTATDLFSLGIVLHEILTGERPNGGLSKAHRQPTDLSRILQKALEKDPADRYPSADEFSADLKRYLEGKPVYARAQTWPYVIGRLMLRHRALTATFTIFVLSLAAATGWAIRQTYLAVRARANADQIYATLSRTSDVLSFELPGLLDEMPGATAARGLALDNALYSLDRLAANPNRTRDLTEKLAFAYEHYGDTQGNTSFRNLGDSLVALRSYEKALALREPIVAAAAPHTELALRRDLAATYEKLGDLQTTRGNLPQATHRFQQALQSYQELAADVPTDRHVQIGLAEVYIDLGRLAQRLGDDGQAANRFQAAQQNFEKLVASDPGDSESKRYLSLIYKQNAVIAADFKEAHHLITAARALDEEQLKENREPVRAREDLAQGYSDEGTVCLHENNVKCANAAFKKSLAMRIALYSSDPADARMRRFLAISYCNVGRAFTRSGAYSIAESNLQRGVALLKTLLDHDPGNIKLLRESALAHQDLAANALLSAQTHASSKNGPSTQCGKAKYNIFLCRTFWGLYDHISLLQGADLALRNELDKTVVNYQRTCAGLIAANTPPRDTNPK